MKLYQDQFSEAHDQPGTDRPARMILIASTPRCGSHMLGHAMAGSGLLGVPYEYCNPANMAEWQRRLGTATGPDTLRRIMTRRTTPNGVFSLKAHFEHCGPMGGFDGLRALMPGAAVVHIRRADVLRQAISYAVARQTGVWITGQEAVSDSARYDAGLIAACLDDIALQNALWVSSFREAGIRPLDVFYESLVADVAGTVTQVARVAGVIGPDDHVPAEAATTRQSQGSRTEDWIRRYRADSRDRRPGLAARLRRRAARLLR